MVRKVVIVGSERALASNMGFVLGIERAGFGHCQVVASLGEVEPRADLVVIFTSVEGEQDAIRDYIERWGLLPPVLFLSVRIRPVMREQDRYLSYSRLSVNSLLGMMRFVLGEK